MYLPITVVGLIVFMLAVYGGTFLLVDSILLERPREWVESKMPFFGKMLSCHYCTGFWVTAGFLSGLYLKPEYTAVALYLFAGAAVAYLFNTVATYLED